MKESKKIKVSEFSLSCLAIGRQRQPDILLFPVEIFLLTYTNVQLCMYVCMYVIHAGMQPLLTHSFGFPTQSISLLPKYLLHFITFSNHFVTLVPFVSTRTCIQIFLVVCMNVYM